MSIKIVIYGLFGVMFFLISSCYDRVTKFPPRTYESEINRANELLWYFQNRFEGEKNCLPEDLGDLISSMGLEDDNWIFWYNSEKYIRRQVWNYHPNEEKILTLEGIFFNGENDVKIAITRDFKIDEY